MTRVSSQMRRSRKRTRGQQSTIKPEPDESIGVDLNPAGENAGHHRVLGGVYMSSDPADSAEAALPPQPPIPSSLRRLQQYYPHPRQPRYGLTPPTPDTAYANNVVIGIRSSDHLKQGRGGRNGPPEEEAEKRSGAEGRQEAGEVIQEGDDISSLLTSSLEQLQADLWGGGGEQYPGSANFVNPATTSDNVNDTSEASTTSTSNAVEEETSASEGESNVIDAVPPSPSTETLLTFEIETASHASNKTEAEATATGVDDDPSFIDSAPESTRNSTLLEAAVEDDADVVESSSNLLPNGCDATPKVCEDGTLNYMRGIPPDCVYPPCYAPGVHDADANGPLQQPPQDGAEPTTGSDGKPLWCPRITELCDDGLTYVGLDPGTDCTEFEPCPTPSPASSSSAGPTTTSSSPAPPTSSPTTTESTTAAPTASPSLSSPPPTIHLSLAPTQNEGGDSDNGDGQNGPEFVSSQPDGDDDDNNNSGPDQQPPALFEPTTPPSHEPTRERNSDDRHNRDWKELNMEAVDDPTSTVQLAPPKPDETDSPSDTSSSTPSQMPTTASPTSEPTASPTHAPTVAPSKVTPEPSAARSSTSPSASSSSPSLTPTYENTISWEPTAEPTLEPTKSRAELVGFRPPTVVPRSEGPTFTFAPTMSPHPTTTMYPTLTPAPTTLLHCLNTDSAYEYGKIKVEGDDMIDTPVMYSYELELIEEPAPGIVQNEVVPAIEVAINEALLPSLFQCQGKDEAPLDGTDSTESATIRARQVDGSPIAGISADPDDIVEQDDSCNSTEVMSDVCHRVLGELTLSLEGDEDLDTQQEAKKAALRLIQFVMDRDGLIGAHPSIERVIFIPMDGDEAAVPPTPAPIAVRNESPTERMRGFPAIITVAILILLAGIYMIYRGLKSKDGGGEGYHKERGLEEHMQTEIEDDAIPGGALTLEDGYTDSEVQPDFRLTVEDEAYAFGDNNYNDEGGDGNEYDYYSQPADSNRDLDLPSTMPVEASRSRASRSSQPSQANRSTETPDMQWHGTSAIQGNFSPETGAFEKSVSSGWGTPSPGTSAGNFNSDIQEQEMSQAMGDEERYEMSY